MKNDSKTDWARIDQMGEVEIDTSDIPPLGEAFFAIAQLRVPEKKVPVTLSVDADVLKWFEAQGAEFQHRVNAALRIYAEAHQQ